MEKPRTVDEALEQAAQLCLRWSGFFLTRALAEALGKRIMALKTIGFVALLAIAAFCSAQNRGPATVTLQAASGSNPVVTWNAAQAVTGGWTGCSVANPCSYQVLMLAASCPSGLIGSQGWSAFTPVSVLTLTDTTEAAGLTVSYVVITLQGGNQSAPSNCVTVTIPYPPAAPANVNAVG